MFWHSFWFAFGSTVGVIAGLATIPFFVLLVSLPFVGRAKGFAKRYWQMKQDEEKAAKEN